MSSERELIRPLKRLMAKPLIGDEQISLLACGEDLREIVLAKLAEKKMPFTKHNRTSSGRSFVLVKVRTYQKKMATVEPARDEQSEVEDTDELGEFPTAEFWQFFYNLDSESRWKLLTEAIHSTQPVWRMKKGFMSFQKGKEVTFTVKSLVRNNNTITAILRPCPDSVENLVHMCEQKWEMEGSKSCAGFNSTGRTNMSLFQQVEIRLPGIQMAKMDADLTVNIDHGNCKKICAYLCDVIFGPTQIGRTHRTDSSQQISNSSQHHSLGRHTSEKLASARTCQEIAQELDYKLACQMYIDLVQSRDASRPGVDRVPRSFWNHTARVDAQRNSTPPSNITLPTNTNLFVDLGMSPNTESSNASTLNHSMYGPMYTESDIGHRNMDLEGRFHCWTGLPDDCPSELISQFDHCDQNSLYDSGLYFESLGSSSEVVSRSGANMPSETPVVLDDYMGQYAEYETEMSSWSLSSHRPFSSESSQ